MNLMNLLLYALCAYGLAYIVGQAQITDRLRGAWYTAANRSRPAGADRSPFLLSMIECPACFGFWTGLVSGYFIADLISRPVLAVMICCALCTTATNHIIHSFTNR